MDVEQIRAELKNAEKTHVKDVAIYDQICRDVERKEGYIDTLIDLMKNLKTSNPEYVDVWGTNQIFLKFLSLQVKLQQKARLIEQVRYNLIRYNSGDQDNNEG